MTDTDLIEKKNRLHSMLSRLNNWDGMTESALLLLKKNEEDIQAIKLIDDRLSKVEFQTFQTENKEWLQTVMDEQQAFLKELKKQSVVLKKQMKQMNQQKKVVHNYMDKEASLFVDREV